MSQDKFESLDYCIEHTHEEEMLNRGIERSRRRRLSHLERNESSITSAGKSMVSQTIQPLAQAIVDFYNDSRIGRPHIAFVMTKDIEPETTAVIVAKHIINTLTMKKALTATAISLGEKIETEVAMGTFAEANPQLFATVKRNLDKRTFNYAYRRRKFRESALRDDNGQWLKWSTNEKLQVGNVFIDLMIKSTGLLEVGTETMRGKKRKILRHTAKTLEWISKREAHTELLNPEYLPTIMPPKDWTDVEGGGYITNLLPKLDLVKVKNKRFKKELRNIDMPEVYKAVNTMQKTPFRINVGIYEVMEDIWTNYPGRAEVPKTEVMDIPNKPHDIDTNLEARKAWRNMAATAHTANKINGSKVLLFNQILWLAKRFLKHDRIWFPVQLDFRGRAYCIPAFLNYQGNTASKALLEFAEGKPITMENNGVFYLAMHGANMFGNDKVSLEDRVDWVQQHEDKIVACANSPIEERWWEDADKPFQFLAFCLEWRDYLQHGDGFISHLPVSVDGSCNGLQLYSLLLKDEHSGKLVNVVPADKPADVYQQLANSVIDKLKESNNPLAPLWLQYGVKRSTVKRAIMTSVYGSTRYSCSDFVLEDLKKRADKGEQHPFGINPMPSASFLSGLIWDSLRQELGSAKVGMGFLQDVAKVVAKDDLPIHWTTPTGFYVQQFYPSMKSKRVKTMLMGEVFKPRINEETDKMDKLRMSNGIAPNFIHSLDSSAMMRTINIAYSKGVNNFATVHDSFGTTAGDMQTLIDSIKEGFIQIFDNTHLLEDFLEEVKSQIQNQKLLKSLPDVPEQSTLEVSKLSECDFFFA